MKQTSLEGTLQSLGFKLSYFDVDKLSLQLEQLNQKIEKVQHMPHVKNLEPAFLLEQRCDNHVNE